MDDAPTTGQLTTMRAVAARKLKDTCTIQNKVRVTGASGNTYTYTTAAASVPCKWAPLGKQERLIAQQVGSQITGRFRFAYAQVVTLTQRIVFNSIAYEVIGVNVDAAWRLQTIADVKQAGPA